MNLPTLIEQGLAVGVPKRKPVTAVTRTLKIADRRIRPLARFARDERGNIAVIFAVAVLPILGLVGAAVDYSRATNARTAMQAALDSTALMISKDAASMTAEQVSTKAKAYFAAMYKHPEAPASNVTAVYTPNAGNGATVQVSASGSIQTNFMKVAGYPTIDFKSGATTTWGNTRLRVAMALDVTGSMNSDGKLPAMKTAAKKLVDTLRSSAQNANDVYISVIPFSLMVNVGTANKNASWLRWNEFGDCNNSYFTNYIFKTECENAGRTWTTDSNKNNWKGCVMDRTQPYDTNKDAPTGAARFHAAKFEDNNNNNLCPAEILPMTSAYSTTDVDKIKTKIDSLVANGSTNQPIGMHWAWFALQKDAPLNTPAKDDNFNYTDAIILLSDGLNTKNRWNGDGSNVSPQVDARQKILCDNIKNTANGKTVIYTIQVNTDGDPESAVLKACADTGNFYPTTTTSGIDMAFNSIGASLTKLKLAK